MLIKNIVGCVGDCGEEKAQIGEHKDIVNHISGANAASIIKEDACYIVSNLDDINFVRDGKYSVHVDGDIYWNEGSLQAIHDKEGAAKSILLAYQQHGEKLFEYLRGTFLFCIKDDDKTLLAIDRVGVKSLFYSSVASQALVFGNRLESVIKHPLVSNEIDAQSLYNYVYFHVVPSPRTIYKHVSKLEPAQYIVKTANSVAIKKYWRPTFVGSTDSFSNLKNELDEELLSSVKRSVTTKNVGAFLSGGVDSSTVTGLLAKLIGNDAKTYSIGFAEETYDEMDYARITSKYFKSNNHEYYVTPEDVAEAIPLIMQAYDEPFGNSSAVPAYFCAKLARQNGTEELLAGDGGDEIFAGNERYAKQKLFSLYFILPKMVRNYFLEPLFLNTPILSTVFPFSKISRYIEQARMQMPDRMETYNFLHHFDAKEIFKKEFFEKIDSEEPIKLLRRVYQEVPEADFLNKMLYLDWKQTLADNDLRKVTTVCELADITVKYPLLDDSLIDFSTRVPSKMKLKGFKLRYFFKEAMRSFLPEETISKSKHGFGLPFGEWLKKSPELQGIVYDLLESLKKRDVFNDNFIEEIIRIHKSDHAAYYGTMVWILAMLEKWLQEHDVVIEV